ncbi:hypothetical protein GCM10027399_22750 [Curvibacter fontanus]|mgnify:CR=1 FL=1|jgi:transcriptional regulator with XRE-family HTH domain
MSIREISRRTGLARNTVKKYLRSDETEPTYAKRVSPSKLDPYAEKLTTWLGIEATKSRKQRRNLKQIYTSTACVQWEAVIVQTRLDDGTQLLAGSAISYYQATPHASAIWQFATSREKSRT